MLNFVGYKIAFTQLHGFNALWKPNELLGKDHYLVLMYPTGAPGTKSSCLLFRYNFDSFSPELFFTKEHTHFFRRLQIKYVNKDYETTTMDRVKFF